jgi:ABC-type dipeptide/oligopeptide/nickel transport system permease subunit
MPQPQDANQIKPQQPREERDLQQPRRRPRTRTARLGLIGGVTIIVMLILCLGSLPYTLGRGETGQQRYEQANEFNALRAPSWAPQTPDNRERNDILRQRLAAEQGIPPGQVDLPFTTFGTDILGRSLFIRSLAGGGISLSIGLAAALISVVIGTLYGTIAAYFGGRVDAVMMRIVDVLFGLPYILLVVLLAVAMDSIVEDHYPDLSGSARQAINVLTLLVAIGGVSWLTMARVIRGQVLSLREQQFMEAARAIGVPLHRQFTRHLLPNLVAPIVVYATLTVPQAILQESFLSFLGIGVKPPLPSWGNLAAKGLSQLNLVESRWWLLFWPCLLLAVTLLSLNFVGEWLREALDPKRRAQPT